MQIRTNKSNNYLPEDLVEYLKRNNESINQAVISEINTLKRIRTVALGELKGIFTPQEWIFFADVFNSVRVEDLFRTNVGVLIATCEDAERFENTATNHRVDMPILIDKIRSLHGANIEALISRVEEYWSHHNIVKIEDWAKF